MAEDVSLNISSEVADDFADPNAPSMIGDAAIPYPPAAPRRSADVQYRQEQMNQAAEARARTAQYRADAAQSAAMAAEARARTAQLRYTKTAGGPEAKGQFVGPYDVYQDEMRQIRTDAANEYADMGMPEMVGSPLFNDYVNQQALGRGLIDQDAYDRTLLPEPETPSPYEDFSRRRSQAESDLRDKFVSEGRGAEIGGKAFVKARQSLFEEGGFAEAEKTGIGGAWERVREDKMGMAFGIGFSAISVGTGAAQVSAMQAGQYVSPEQIHTAETNAWVPGAAGVAGTIIGTAIGGAAGGLAGQFIGGAAGQAISSVVGASDERNQATRETAERLAQSLGAAAETVERFKGIIEATGAPVQQLGQGLETLQGLSPGVGAAAITGAGGMALAEGGRFQEITSGVGGFLSSNAALYGATAQFATTGGAISAQDYRSIADYALFTGDMGAYNAAQGGAAAARYAGDAAATADAKELAGRKGSWGDSWLHWANAVDHTIDSHLGLPDYSATRYDPIRDAQSTLDARKNQIDATAAATSAGDLALSQTYGAARFGLAQSQAQTSYTQSGIDLARAQGADGVQIGGMLPGLNTALAGRAAADQTFISQGQAAIAKLDPNDPTQASLRLAYQQDVLKAQLDASQVPLLSAQAQRDATVQGIGDRESAFRRGNLEDTLSGKTNAEQFAGDTAYYKSLITDSRTLPNLTRPQQDALASEGAQGVYQQQQGVFSERLDTLNTGMTAAGARLSQASASGTPGDVAGAQGQEISGLAARFRELTQELATTGQTAADYRREQQQLNETISQGAAAVGQQRRDYFASVGAIDSAGVAAAGAGLGRDVSISGSSAFNRLLGPERQSVSDLTAAYNAARAGSVERANYGAQLAQARASLADTGEQSQIYRLNVGERMADEHLRTGYELSRLAPFTDAGGDPFSRSRGLIGQDTALAGRYAQAAAHASDPLAREANQQSADRYRLEAATLQHDQMYAVEGMLPQMIAGLPGGGVGSALLPFAALSATGHSGPLSGSWGGSPGAGAASALTGGRAGGLGQNDSVVALLSRIANALEKGGTPTSSVTHAHAASVVNALSKSLNANKLH